MVLWTIILWLCSVPEGLGLTLGVCLAFSVKKMYKDGILIRDLSSPETLGRVNEIVVGKTGTLTTAKMRVSQFHCDHEKIKHNSRKNSLMNCEIAEFTLKILE
jgi:P-type E1-E2 ATPase